MARPAMEKTVLIPLSRHHRRGDNVVRSELPLTTARKERRVKLTPRGEAKNKAVLRALAGISRVGAHRSPRRMTRRGKKKKRSKSWMTSHYQGAMISRFCKISHATEHV